MSAVTDPMEPTEEQVDAAASALEVAISSGWKLRPMARAAIRAALAVTAGRAGGRAGGRACRQQHGGIAVSGGNSPFCL